MSNDIRRLEETVKGTIANGTFYFDAERVFVQFHGWFTRWSLSWMSSILGATGTLIAGVVQLIAGKLLLAVSLGGLAAVLLAAVSGWAQTRHAFVIDIAAREIRYRLFRMRFADVRDEYWLWQEERDYITIMFRGPHYTRRIAQFRSKELPQAGQFFWLLRKLVAEGNMITAVGYSSELTPVQWWLMGPPAVFAAANGFGLTKLGGNKGDAWAARKIIKDPNYWDIHDVQALLSHVDSLVFVGHRNHFVGTARVAALPDQAKAEYVSLLRQADELIVQGCAPEQGPLQEVLASLLVLRTDAGERDPDDEAYLAWALTTDRDFAAEEINRLEMLRNGGGDRYLIWDYARAFMLLRWGHIVGWLPEEYCWERMLPLARDVQRHYASWDDMVAWYLEGRRVWAGGRPESQDLLVKRARQLRESVINPFNVVPWDLPLVRDW